MNKLYVHGHLIVDSYRQYEDGSLLIDDNHIIDVFCDSKSTFDGDLNQTEIIDLKGKLVFPAFFNCNELDKYQSVIDPLKPIDSNKKIMIGKSAAYLKDVNIEYDGYYDLFHNMTGFDAYNFGLVNGAFNDDKYVEVDSSLDKSILSVIYRLKRKDRIILIGDVYLGIKKMFEIGANYNELLLMSSLNAYRLFEIDKLNGSLIKGKSNKIEIIGDLNV